jgi:hypothetical protein
LPRGRSLVRGQGAPGIATGEGACRGEGAWCAGRGRGLAGGIPGAADGRARMGAPMEGIAGARIAGHSRMTHIRAR